MKGICYLLEKGLPLKTLYAKHLHIKNNYNTSLFKTVYTSPMFYDDVRYEYYFIELYKELLTEQFFEIFFFKEKNKTIEMSEVINEIPFSSAKHIIKNGY